jgi:hypothetical protein
MKGKKVNKVVMAQLKMPAWNVSGVNEINERTVSFQAKIQSREANYMD